MAYQISLVLSPDEAASKNKVLAAAARKARVDVNNVAMMRIVRRSIDARKGVKINLGVELFVDGDQQPEPVHFDYNDVSTRPAVAIVGSGPAGLFAALRLIEQGLRPVVVERGKDVSTRRKDLATINRGGEVDSNSNYAFGEGGAGTYSDGKLYTRSKKRGDYHKCLQVFKFFGASEEILYDAHPHIGTDKLPTIIAAMREQIIASGGIVLFEHALRDILIKDDKIQGVVVENIKTSDILVGSSFEPVQYDASALTTIEAGAVMLATGHSARDVYHLLHNKGVALEAKAYAMGVRVEHPQTLIDKIQYKMRFRGPNLPAASYSLVAQVGSRGVYSFCMCPGGFIVPAKTAASEAVVNGMSPSLRNSVYANSGIVTEIREEDYAHLVAKHGVLAGLVYQQQLEALAYENGGQGNKAPAQRLTDFVAGRSTSSLPKSSYVPGMEASDMFEWLPANISNPLREGFRAFDKKMHGFLTGDAVVLGVESRTSSPVRIPRDRETFMHPQIEGLFPVGEGAGFAGGIISSAIDGEVAANAVRIYMDSKK